MRANRSKVSAVVILCAMLSGGCSDRERAKSSDAASTAIAGGAAPVVNDAPTRSDRRPICSGCASETPRTPDSAVHLHHIHLNVSDRSASERFYQRFLGAEPVFLNGVTSALYAKPTLLLLDQVAAPIGTLPTALQHVGWGSSDVSAWFDMAHAAGVSADTRGNTLFNTFATPTIGVPGDGADAFGAAPACFPRQNSFSYMYMLGPDQERVEIWSGADERVNHVHFTTPDVVATGTWYRQLLSVSGKPDNTLADSFFLDDILFFFEAIGSAGDYRPTDDHVLGHIAFSVVDLNAWLQRVADSPIEVVSQPAIVHGFKSFFVRGPDGMLIELVEASPNADLCPMPK